MKNDNRFTSVEQILERTKLTNSGCMEWQQAVGANNYGYVWFNGKIWSTHRLVATFVYGEHPSSTHVLHSCDNPPCINPEHLSFGTAHENMLDKWLKGRAKGGSMKGESHPQSKLTAAQVAEIRADYGPGMTTWDLAEKYGVSKTAIKNIINHKSWK